MQQHARLYPKKQLLTLLPETAYAINTTNLRDSAVCATISDGKQGDLHAPFGPCRMLTYITCHDIISILKM
jgi:hypothetical protein